MTACLVCGLSLASDLAGQPVAGWRHEHVILKSGSVFSGIVERTGNVTTVRTDNGAVVRLNHDEIDFVADSLDYAASRLANRILDDPVRHAKLAHWCLNYGALAGARRQIDWLIRHGGDPGDIGNLQSLLDRAQAERDLALTVPSVDAGMPAPLQLSATSRTRKLPSSVPGLATRAELRQAVESLSRESRKYFTSQIQNRVVAGCAAARCHGDNSTSMRLWGSTGGHGLDSTSAQRNLHAILQQINRRYPESSPFLRYLSLPHGGRTEPVFTPDSREWALIRDWILSTRRDSPADRELPDTRIVQASWDYPLSREAAGSRPPQPVDLLQPLQPESTATNDPFDPQAFNRKYAGPRPPAERSDPPPLPEPQPRPVADAPPAKRIRPLPPVDDIR